MIEPAPPRRRALLWAASCVGAVVLLWLASRKVPLWPDVLHLPRPGLFALAAALHLPYSLTRAVRLRWALPPGAPVSRDLLVGSGLVSFLVILLLPLRLGELSRPLILARAGVAGLGLPEAIAAIASERLLDGLLVVGMLFLGLGLSTAFSPEFAALVGSVERFGLASGVVFAGLMLALGLLAFTPAAPRAPRRPRASRHRRPPRRLRVPPRRRLAADLHQRPRPLPPRRLAGLLGDHPPAVVAGAPGLRPRPRGRRGRRDRRRRRPQHPAARGPAQVGSFQFGAALALQLFIGPADLRGPGASFGALMYLLGLLGALVLALPGLALLGRDRRRRVIDPSSGPPSEPGPIA
ncbi:hypothetical protein [Nannocystis pusilla]|uniref:hypothetical protein n=1 Tax=Nannocystis pusilla TaxID=889268 RepID=UPI003B76FA1E